ncbi:hypothetical protein GDO78_001597 [Eleutherodactylus coqui]|uniref:Uncharacterized protein n=1 Tax=Eleutherodactylus coqui TaxID=57060 RepID=A0A8J6KNT8_ELECQ|nr:hypothetical protein GDO78_001597 [Eleutherodactylus coqui]
MYVSQALTSREAIYTQTKQRVGTLILSCACRCGQLIENTNNSTTEHRIGIHLGGNHMRQGDRGFRAWGHNLFWSMGHIIRLH